MKVQQSFKTEEVENYIISIQANSYPQFIIGEKLANKQQPAFSYYLDKLNGLVLAIVLYFAPFKSFSLSSCLKFNLYSSPKPCEEESSW